MTKEVTCLFLGSGASYALNDIPVQRDFLCSLLSEKRSQWIDDCGMKINGVPLSSWMIEVGDIEMAMSCLHDTAYSNPLPKKGKPPRRQRNAIRAIVNVRTAIADYLNHKQKQIGQHANKSIKRRFCKFINGIRKKSDLVVLFTNYDLVFERLFSNPAKEYHYPDIPITSNSNNERKPISLYKLHGSMNWLEERWWANGGLNSRTDISQKPKVYVGDSLLPTPEKIGNWAYLFKMRETYAINGESYNTYNPILIPFFSQKADWIEEGRWKDIFKGHWDSAKKLLENELEQIYFIGYSLPPADHYTLSWLLEILEKSKPVITIVNNSQNEPLEKALGSFRPKVYQCGLENFLDGHV